MLRTGDYSFSNLTLAHWIGKSDISINSGEPGVLLNPKDLMGAWNSIRLVFIYRIIHCIFWSDPGLCNC